MLAQIYFDAVVFAVVMVVFLSAYVGLGHARSRLPNDKPWRRLWCIVLVCCLCGCAADYQGYAKCQDCGAAFQLRYGLPGQHNLSHCRFCDGGPLLKCSKEESGWRDDIPKDQWNWD